MAIKKYFLITLFILTVSSLYSQSNEYFREMRFVQRLSWSGDDYAMRYEAVIEKEVDGLYRHVSVEYTKEQYIMVSLSAGSYRYQIFPYDFLDQRGSGSGWIEFEVLPALNPELHSTVTEFDTVEINGFSAVNKIIINLHGRDIDRNAEIFICADGEDNIFPEKIENLQDGGYVRLTFNDPFSIPENFEIFVKNPGGFETNISGVCIIPLTPVPSKKAPEKKVDFFAGIAFMPQFRLFGSLKGDFAAKINLPAAALRLGAVYIGLDFLQIGAEISGCWFFYEDDLNSAAADVCLIACKTIPNGNLSFSLRLGAGYSFIFEDFPKVTFSHPVYMNTGIFLQWTPFKYMYLDFGIDLLSWFYGKNPTSFLRPFVGSGVKF